MKKKNFIIIIIIIAVIKLVMLYFHYIHIIFIFFFLFTNTQKLGKKLCLNWYWIDNCDAEYRKQNCSISGMNGTQKERN